MYYVIKKQHSQPEKNFIGFSVVKFYTSKTNDTVIFEFNVHGKMQRKWVKKDDIILLTDNKALFLKTMKRFKKVEEVQQKLVDDAKQQLDDSIENFTEAINGEIEAFFEIKEAGDIPCLLNEIDTKD